MKTSVWIKNHIIDFKINDVVVSQDIIDNFLKALIAALKINEAGRNGLTTAAATPLPTSDSDSSFMDLSNANVFPNRNGMLG